MNGDEELNIETAQSAVEFLKLLEENKYDAIVSGYKVPEMDGLEFLETVRNKKDRVKSLSGNTSNDILCF